MLLHSRNHIFKRQNDYLSNIKNEKGIESNDIVTRGGICEQDFSNLAGIGEDMVMLSSYDCSIKQVEVGTHGHCCLLII